MKTTLDQSERAWGILINLVDLSFKLDLGGLLAINGGGTVRRPWMPIRCRPNSIWKAHGRRRIIDENIDHRTYTINKIERYQTCLIHQFNCQFY